VPDPGRLEGLLAVHDIAAALVTCSQGIDRSEIVERAGRDQSLTVVDLEAFSVRLVGDRLKRARGHQVQRLKETQVGKQGPISRSRP
jgi:hypothetical protein